MFRQGSSVLLLCILLLAGSFRADASHLGHHRRMHYEHRRQYIAARSAPVENARSGLDSLISSFAGFVDQARSWLLSLEQDAEHSTGAVASHTMTPAGNPSTSASDITSSAAAMASSASEEITKSLQATIIDTRTATSTLARLEPSETVVSGVSGTGGSVPSPASLAFDPMSSTNIVVYYGQDPQTTAQGLEALCHHPRISIINIAFVTDFFYNGNFPRTAFGPACDLPQNQFQQQRAPGLQNCTTLGKQINTCQKQYGKKIFISLGGYNANVGFSSTAQAQQAATNLWNLFGGGTATPNLRPFGPGVYVDGFDIDNEDHSTAYWADFGVALKARFTQAYNRKYYLSAAPQCPRPDASIPIALLRMCDFVSVQFYNNPSCNLDTTGFASSVAGWSADLRVAGKSTPQLLVGIPAWSGAGPGYVPGSNLQSIIPSARSMRAKYPNFGGLMTWAGPEAVFNVDAQGQTFLQRMAAILEPGV